MSVKKPKNPASVVESRRDEPMFTTWAADGTGQATAFASTAKALTNAEPFVQRTAGTNAYQNVAPGNVSVRDGYDRRDYDYFRPGEAIPTKPKEIIAACMQAYDRIGPVKNTIDLMADFACAGIDLVHPNPRIEKFFKGWAKQVKMKDRTERALNLLYRGGNVIIKRQTAKLRQADIDNIQRAQGEADLPADSGPKPPKNEIPWAYTILNPMSIEVLGEELAPFLGSDHFTYGVKLSQSLVRKIKNPRTTTDKALIAKLPANITAAIRAGETVIPLDPTKVRAMYYKKDDWQVWANPMTYAILEDLVMLKKMKLADLAALDGAISHIRLWKLGNFEHRILPTEHAINRLAEMLLNNVGGGSMDLIWTPDIELSETSTEIAKFLGEEKYGPVLTAIYAGLGIPPTMTGAATQSGFTNNYISIKTLVERLQYGRDVITAMWEEEIRAVQLAMGFRFPAQCVFDRMTLTDEASLLALFIQMADRDLISAETIQERFGEIPEVEEVRMRREARRRKNEQLPAKAGPFHTAEKSHDLKKIIAQSGAHAPSELGVSMDEKKPGEMSPMQHEKKFGPKPAAPVGTAKKKGVSEQGRPRNKKDSKKRKARTVKPRTKASFMDALSWAEHAQQVIAEVTQPAYLHSVNKKNLRALTTAESEALEKFKFATLANLDVHAKVDEEAVKRVVASPLVIPHQVTQLVKATVTKHIEREGKEPTVEKVRQIQAAVVALFKADVDEEASDSGNGPS
ncbi:MAG: hypothetical protein K2R98_19450 [Gemmataceae bacterium]|nr:hypothetical protein [Gemmataceae bacterium]